MLIGLQLTLAGKGLRWIGGQFLHPPPQHVFVQIKVARRLSHAHAPLRCDMLGSPSKNKSMALLIMRPRNFAAIGSDVLKDSLSSRCPTRCRTRGGTPMRK
jgi:hypothetical protein